MKKVCVFCIMLLMAANSLKVQAQFTPDIGKTYYIVHSSLMILGNDGGVTISNPTATNAQYVKFIPAEAGFYNIQVVSTGEYLTKTGNYNTAWGSDPENVLAQFAIDDVDGTFVKFRISGTLQYLGTDASTSGSAVYSDKSGAVELHHWTIREVGADGELLTFALDSQIGVCQAMLAAAVVGPEKGQYTQAVYDDFAAAIANAQNARSSAIAQEAITLAMTALVAAREAFVSLKTQVSSGQIYYIVHSGGLFLSDNGSNNPKLNSPAGTTAQQFIFMPVESEPGVYNIQIQSRSSYIARSGYNIVYGTDPTLNTAKFRIEDAPTAGYIRFKCLDNSRYIGTDANSDGSGVYIDKAGNTANHYWKVREYIEGEIIKDGLEAAIASAQSLLGRIVVGTAAHQYPQEAYDAFAAAIAAAQTVYNNSAVSQDDVATAAAALQTAQTDFLAAEIKPVFIPAADKYRITTYKYATKYLTNVEGNARTADVWTSGNSGQHWVFQPVTDGAGEYYLLNGGKYLSASTSAYALVDEVASATVWRFSFNSTNGGVEWFAMQTGDNQTVACGSGTTWTLQTYQPTNNAHWVRLTRVDFPHDPSKLALEDYIPKATTTLNAKTIGTEQGQWPQSAFDAFKAVINAATAAVDGAGYTQEEVDARLEELKAAETAYNAAAISVIKDALGALLLEAYALWDAAVIGEHVGEYLPSVKSEYKAKFDASKAVFDNSSVQADVDAEVVTLQASIDAFIAAANTVDVSPEAVLYELAMDAEAIYAASVEGIDMGQYAPTVRADFRSAIDAALAAAQDQTATTADIETLQAAITLFQQAVITVNRSVFRATIQTADQTLAAAANPAQYVSYPQAAIDALTDALNTATTVCNTNYAATQPDIDAANATLTAAIAAFNAAVVNRTSLNTSIQNAQTLLSSSEPGDANGQRPQSAFDALRAAATSAQTVFDSPSSVQTDLDAANTALNTAIAAFNSAVIAVDFTSLDAAIAKAAHYRETTTAVGNEQRQCPQAVFDVFVAILTPIAAMDRTVTQATADAKTAELNAAIDALLTQLKSELEELIVQATELYSQATEGDAPGQYPTGSKATLMTAVNKAVASRDDAAGTQATFNTASGALYNAIYLFQNKQIPSAVESVDASTVTVYSANQTIHICNLEGNSRIAIYDLSGALIHAEQTDKQSVACSLNKGSYVVSVQSENSRWTQLVVN
ncbi:MAG: FIVAR domain-containing protein [Bacteroidales bacterium]|jgi:hypothetical protein|nr:FIVAR domain-containing protein [Bacteroidales bacterium]